MRFFRNAGAPAVVAVLALVASGVGCGSAFADGDVQKGKAAFLRFGCWQCHDFAGEGSVATSNGKVIARTALPLDAFDAFIRNTNGAMPPFRSEVIYDADLADIYAYLQSLPPPKPVADIPLLNDARAK
jgi:mono/diheme cytochrome c family protein